MHEKISACVIAFNEERKIKRCLQSLTWCDEIIVLDSFSTDRTVEICKEFTARVYQHEWLGYVGQRNLVREMSTYPWILFLDSDEEVSPTCARRFSTSSSTVPVSTLATSFRDRCITLVNGSGTASGSRTLS